jgi:hypothetical protein
MNYLPLHVQQTTINIDQSQGIQSITKKVDEFEHADITSV